MNPIRLILVIFSSLLYAVSLPNEILHYGSLAIGAIALIPLFYALFKSANLRESVLLGAVFGLISTTSVYFWLMFFEDFSIWTLTGATAVHILYFCILAPFITMGQKYKILRPFITAALWVSYEYLKSTGYLGFPWGLMAHTTGIAPFVQIADITGQWGVSFLVVLINTMILETLITEKRILVTRWIFTVFIIVLSMGYGYYSTQKEIHSEKSMTVMLVQQDADSWITGREIESIKQGQDLTRAELAKSGIKPDLVVWSENAFRFPYTQNSSRYEKSPEGDPFNKFLKEIDTYMLVGSPYVLDQSTMSVLNSVLLLAPEGNILEHYGKIQLVPFAENIPFWNFKPVRTFFQNVIGINNPGWTHGDPNIIFRIPIAEGGVVSFGAPICFEDSFPYIARNFIRNGADILINLSNDSWSKTISGETQHLAAARLRSIENRCTLIRSTNAGVTTIIDPRGRMNYTLPLFRADSVTAEISVYRKTRLTVYTTLGEWFPITLILLMVIFRIYDVYIKKEPSFMLTAHT